MAFILADLYAVRFLFNSALALGNSGLIDWCQTRRKNPLDVEKMESPAIQAPRKEMFKQWFNLNCFINVCSQSTFEKLNEFEGWHWWYGTKESKLKDYVFLIIHSVISRIFCTKHAGWSLETNTTSPTHSGEKTPWNKCFLSWFIFAPHAIFFYLLFTRPSLENIFPIASLQ